MKKMDNKKVILTGLFAALVAVGTMIIQIPTPSKGYVHMGDALVVLSGFILGPAYGFLSAGIGSFLADMLSGYSVYAPATFIIKGLDAMLFAIIYSFIAKNVKKGSVSPSAFALAGIAGGAVMVAGYFLFETFLNGYGSAITGVIPNIAQAGFGIGAGFILAVALKKIKIDL